MQKNMLTQIKSLFVYREPKGKSTFILEETLEEKNSPLPGENQRKNKENSSKKNSEDEEKKKDSKKDTKINPKLDYSLDYIKEVYYIPVNGDVVIREFEVNINSNSIKAFMVFIDGMVDRKVIDDDIMQPMALLSNLSKNVKLNNIADFIKNQLINHGQIKESDSYQEMIDEINFGGCAIFVDGLKVAFAADVKGWEHRSVGKPASELVIRGPQEGFNEIIRMNTALVRKIIKDENLIVENIIIGKRSKTPCALMYIKDIANESLVKEVRRRLKSINIDYLVDAGELEQLIEDSTFLSLPQMLATERPDRVAALLAEGKVSVVINGTPFVLVMPSTLPEMMSSSEDNYIRFPYGILIKVVRLLGVLMSLLLPGIYVAMTNFHQEMIPTDLVLAIASSRENVPFPLVIEILVMELAFELIREAGIRIPGPIGPTLGIIGALILGQAAVAANIVSPILIIIVAVTGIGSFAIPSFSLAFSFRVIRFAYIILGATAGFLGISFGIFIQGLNIVTAKSFGVPLLTPFAPKTSDGFFAQLLRGPIWKQEMRPDYVNAQKTHKQEKFSRGWVKEDMERGDEKDEK